ncbi:glutamate decarboxylase [Rhodococcus sp. 15-649-1-2]|nr:glutamate decarboxylase [Rhodococcus sp. 15-649-1-2]OZE82951.1 glutamate decarboxylase [Rhodococcus sp. 15-649-1-2]
MWRIDVRKELSKPGKHPGGVIAAAYTGRLATDPIPALRLPDEQLDPEAAYRFIHDELMLDGSSRLNLATFVTTWMDPQAEKLMAETFDKNMIDKDEYPATASIEERCVNMVADLFHAPGLDPEDSKSATGVSTIGSSEAVMLAGLALKWRWREGRSDTSRPNLVLGSNVQVVWEKFCRYFDVEPKYLPVEPGRYVITPEQVRDAVDDNTIGVVAILGTTFTGELEPVAEICAMLDSVAASGGPDVPVHVDAASGGFVVPFLHPHLEWDFRLPRVKSINASGHKYGLTYPGIGFAVWRTREDLPEDLVFRVNYLGGDMPTFTLNFSRPGNQVIGQYYNFLRLGRSGYSDIMHALRDTAVRVAGHLSEHPAFHVITDGSAIPVVAFELAGDREYTVFDISYELRARGWQVPAYTMPDDATGVAVLRIVVREGFSADLGRLLCGAITEVIDRLDASAAGGGHSSATHFAH